MRKYLFYPGCSLERNASAYYDSVMALREPLGIEFEEIEDWNCCGATEYTSLHRLGSFALQGRNLALAAKQVAGGNNVLAAPCSACYLNLSKAEHYLRGDEHLAAQVNEALATGGLSYRPGTIDVRHMLDILLNDIGLEEIRAKVVKPLTGLRVAAYYGCFVIRPDYEHRFSSPEYPTVLEDLLEVLGAEVVEYPAKAHCCSGHMPSISAPSAYELIRRLIAMAVEKKAHTIVTLCPMCQLNLDAYQADMNRFFGTKYRMPILYFTQLIGLAFGKAPEELGFGKELVDARPALKKIGVKMVHPAEETGGTAPAAPKPRKKEEGLPMPKMPAKHQNEEVS
ncbi:MAG TPA: CoB--CoM heterodisulfide reductase iron-sulfur subunit B family protein [Anaerolineaceae bacterium]|nr:CoB--CoM heterodisulfide reductase iron-sulfur subunit B family protein [Anaerolineaceae bacterium]